jgi:hypothetical protein
MDELTMERYPHGVPYHEAEVFRTDEEMVARRRIALCGTADLTVLERGGHLPGLAKHRRLLHVIRTWVA